MSYMMKLKKFSQPEHFQLIIDMATNDDLAKISHDYIVRKMKELKTQALLKNLLLNFKFYSRAENKTRSHLVDFRGQRERDDRNRLLEKKMEKLKF